MLEKEQPCTWLSFEVTTKTWQTTFDETFKTTTILIADN